MLLSAHINKGTTYTMETELIKIKVLVINNL